MYLFDGAWQCPAFAWGGKPGPFAQWANAAEANAEHAGAQLERPKGFPIRKGCAKSKAPAPYGVRGLSVQAPGSVLLSHGGEPGPFAQWANAAQGNAKHAGAQLERPKGFPVRKWAAKAKPPHLFGVRGLLM